MENRAGCGSYKTAIKNNPLFSICTERCVPCPSLRALHHLPFALCCLVFALCICLFSVASASASDGLTAELKKIKILGNSNAPYRPVVAAFTVETAADALSRRKGLTGREKMNDDHGMLFILDDNYVDVFWMKGMNFPIDILFFDRNRRLIDVFADLSPCSECPFIMPSRPAAYALEINAGMAEKYDIRIGDMFVLENQ
ncbi:MAG: DUF192 domain-containing protein [Nitrospirota bacterium]